MSESSVNVTPGSGGPNIDLEQVDNGNARQVVCLGDPSASAKVAPVDGVFGVSVNPTKLPPGAAQEGGGNLAQISLNTAQLATTQPVSVASMPLPSNAAKEAGGNLATIAANTAPVTGQKTMANSEPMVIASDQTAIPTSVNNFPATQAVSAAALPLPSGASSAANQAIIAANQTNGTQQTQIVQAGNTATVDGQGHLKADVTNLLSDASSQCVTATGATGAAVTATLPAVASQFHYITLIEIHKYFTVANAASATPLIVTTTNLPGPLAFTFGQPLGAIGVTDERIYPFAAPLKSSVVNTATTIVCPATTGIIWRVTVTYLANP